MNAETTNDVNNTTAGEAPDLSREGDNDTPGQNEVNGLTRDMLPVLTERFVKQARSESGLKWARGIFGAYLPGMLHMDSERGFVLQVLHPNTVRVIQVFETIECFSSLSMVVETMTSAGIEVEIDGFAQITTPPASSPPEDVGPMEAPLADASSESMLDLVDGIGDLEPGMGTTASNERTTTEIGMWC